MSIVAVLRGQHAGLSPMAWVDPPGVSCPSAIANLRRTISDHCTPAKQWSGD